MSEITIEALLEDVTSEIELEHVTASLVMEATLEGISSDIDVEYYRINLEIEPTLDGASGDILLKGDTFFKRIPILFDMKANAIEDIPLIVEWQGFYYKYIPFEFSLAGVNVYNYEYIPFVFHAIMGSVFEDVPLMFSIIRQAQDFASYIMQKTYSVTTELNGFTDLEISDWNVSPNKTWYVYVNGLIVTLYDTLADMEALTNPVAAGIANSTDLTVVLAYVDLDLGTMEYYYQDFAYHLALSENIASVHNFCIKPFTDLSEIRHPIYNNSNIVLSRGEAELNVSTFTVLSRELVLGTHLPEMEVGDVVDLTSVRRSKTAEKSQILSQTITGEVSDGGESSLVNTIRVANYMELYRR
jgi:hypothetical protein